MSMAAMWPSNVDEQQLLRLEQTNRDDGSDWSMGLRFAYANGIQSRWEISGRVWERSWGREWIVGFGADNIPPSLAPAQFPQRIHSKIAYDQPSSQIAGQQMRAATVEMTTTYADGHGESTRQAQLLALPLAEFSAEETAHALGRLFAGETFERAFTQQQLRVDGPSEQSP